MARTKQPKFEHNRQSPYVVEPGKVSYETIKGNWHKDFFQNDNDIILELACGRGEYTTGFGALFPNKNFIGIDIKGDRIAYGSRVATEKGLKNVAFLRTIIHHIDNFFEENEVAEIWIIHPDPRPKKKDIRRRLTNPRFLEMYQKIMKPEGIVHLKTDNRPLYDYTLEVIEEEKLPLIEGTTDLYNSPLLAEHHGITTKYERIFTEQGYLINYVKFGF